MSIQSCHARGDAEKTCNRCDDCHHSVEDFLSCGLSFKKRHFTNFFLEFFNTILPLFLLTGEGRGSPYWRGKRSLPGGRGFFYFFENPTRPLFTLKEGLHLPPKSSLLRSEDLKPGRPGLYSQTSSRPFGVARDYLRNRVAIVYAPRAPMRILMYADTSGRFAQVHGFLFH